MRMVTFTKLYKSIKEYCMNHKEFRLQTKEGFGDIKLATHFAKSWYNYVSDYCPPRSNKRMTNQGTGNPVENRESSKAVKTTELADQSETQLNMFAAVVWCCWACWNE
ncbi:uncharacterized protein [Physcomitrium patens]|uniref:uncharacterized protein n=1 Tax=Physcomitrium patens TaxID=3218 RepID=UPI003CCD24DC